MALLLFLSLILPTAAFSETRAEEWERLRKEKKEKLVPNKMSFSEKTLLAIEKSGFGLTYKGFTPSLASITTGAGVGGQLRYWKQHFLTEEIDLQVITAYTTRSYQLYNVQFGKILRKGVEPIVGGGGSGGFHEFHGLQKRGSTDYFLYLDARYSNLPQEDFYGLGEDSIEENRTNYGLEMSSGSLFAGYRLQRYILLAGGVRYLQPNLFQGKDDRFPTTEAVFDETTAPGLTRTPDFLVMALAFVLDYRDRPGNPHKGGMLGFEVTRYNDRGGNQYEFTRYQFDARQYIPLASQQRILALRMLTSFEDPDGDASVPFYLQETLGGGEVLRGYDDFRFRDKNLFYMSGEYRWEAHAALEFALFYDTGKVFADRSDFNFEDLRDSYGFGVRFKLAHSQFLRIDTAKSEEGTIVYVRFGLASF